VTGLTRETAVVVGVAPPGSTVCGTPAEALALKFASPLYPAVSVLAPAVAGETLQLVAGSVIVQFSPPGVDVTVIVPVGVPAPGPLASTPAVTLIGALAFDGSGVCALIDVVVPALLTVAVPLPPPLEALGA
jgi:hypothetical protein